MGHRVENGAAADEIRPDRAMMALRLSSSLIVIVMDSRKSLISVNFLQLLGPAPVRKKALANEAGARGLMRVSRSRMPGKIKRGARDRLVISSELSSGCG